MHTSIFLLTAISSLASIATAANCYSGPTWEYESNTYSDSWNIRSTMCGDMDKANCRTLAKTTICELQSGDVYGGFRASSKDEAKSICWDAFNNIINQCIYNNQPGGFYTYNDMAFSIQPIKVGQGHVNN